FRSYRDIRHQSRTYAQRVFINVKCWRMQSGTDSLFLITYTAEVKTRIRHLRVISKVFRCHPDIRIDHVLFAEILYCIISDISRKFLFADQARIPPADTYFTRSTHSRRDFLGHVFNETQRLLAPGLIHRAKGALQLHLIGNDIERAVSDYRAKREHGGLLRTRPTTHNLLKRDNDVGSNNHRIDKGFRLGTMTPFSNNPDRHRIHRRHVLSSPDSNLADRHARHRMLSNYSNWHRISQCPFLDHQRGTAGQYLLSRLKKKFNCSLEFIPATLQYHCGSQ